MKQIAILLLASAGFATSAAAAPVTPFLTGSSQGDGFCESTGGLPDNCSAVVAARSNVFSIDDSDPGSDFYSLGVNGFLDFNVTPFQFGDDVFAIEITFTTPNPTFPESAIFEFSGPSGTEFVELTNEAGGILSSSAGISGSTVVGSDSTTYNISLSGLSFQMLTITDTTFVNYAGSYDNLKSDGFDIEELVFSVTPLDIPGVPAPAAFGLFGLGLAALGMSRRRK